MFSKGYLESSYAMYVYTIGLAIIIALHALRALWADFVQLQSCQGHSCAIVHVVLV